MISRDGKSLRVLMISPQFQPIVGGYERAAERLSAALAGAGLGVVVITERRDRAWPARERIDGYDVQRLSCVYRPRRHIITSLFSFAGFLLRRGREFDVWHVHQYGVHAALSVALGKILRRPVALKLTSTAPMGIERAMGSGVVGRILRFFHRRVSACIAISDETRTEALRFGVTPGRIQLIPNGVDSRQFYPASPDERAAARRKLGLDCELLVLCVGRLVQPKNQAGLLEAWGAIGSGIRDGSLLVLVGDGPDWKELNRRAQGPDLAGSVYFAGSRSDVAVWYQAADVYVLSSHREGLSNTMIEALASGLPVISTPVSGSSILVESPPAGLVVDFGDVGMLARAMQCLMQDASMRKRLGENARVKFESNFSLEGLSEKIISLYKGLRDRNARQT